MPGDAELMMQEILARADAYQSGCSMDRLSHVDPDTISMAQQMLSYFIPQQVKFYCLSGNAGISFH